MSGDNDGLAIGVLGCGNLATAILGGVLIGLEKEHDQSSRKGGKQLPRLPNRFFATVTREESAKRIREILATRAERVKILIKDNLKCAKECDVILLGCKPYMYETVLGQEGMADALSGKVLISLLAGVPTEQLEGFLSDKFGDKLQNCRVVRAMPNTAAAVGESMTVIGNKTPPLPEEDLKVINWIFSQVGQVTNVSPNWIDACTALCGSGTAFCALMLEALADGALAMGIPRQEAQNMAAQVMRGTSALILDGQHPAILREKTSSPGGCTIGGLLVLEEKGVRGAVSRAVREATVVASQLGQGVQGVNGTRW